MSLVSGEDSSGTEQRLMAVLLMLLIRDIAPRLTASPALADIAVKLVTQIASGPASAAFKTVVTTLPPQDKVKLQVLPLCPADILSDSLLNLYYSPSQRILICAQMHAAWVGKCVDAANTISATHMQLFLECKSSVELQVFFWFCHQIDSTSVD